jgi:hypothetical protein
MGRRSAATLGVRTWTWFYDTFIPQADDLYGQHLAELKREGLI